MERYTFESNVEVQKNAIVNLLFEFEKRGNALLKLESRFKEKKWDIQMAVWFKKLTRYAFGMIVQVQEKCDVQKMNSNQVPLNW